MPEKLQEVLGIATRKLAAAGIESPRWDAEQLAAHCLGVSRSQLVTVTAYDPEALDRFDALVARRADREPLQHITGSLGFRHIDLEVGPGVFIPRPETEVVAGWAIDAVKAMKSLYPIVVDLCTGSGALALSLANEIPSVKVHAVEVDPGALEWARRNGKTRAAAGDPEVTFHLEDVAVALSRLDGQVDAVVSNPPYVADDEIEHVQPEVRDHDPRVALVAGPDGLGVIRAVATTALRLLRPGGVLVVEHSDRQGEVVPSLLHAQGFTDIADHLDLAGRPRFATARRSER